MSRDPKDVVCEAAFDLTYGWHDREFCELNGGIAVLNDKLQKAVDAWAAAQPDSDVDCV
jgi:hypothetical protein